MLRNILGPKITQKMAVNFQKIYEVFYLPFLTKFRHSIGWIILGIQN